MEDFIEFKVNDNEIEIEDNIDTMRFLIVARDENKIEKAIYKILNLYGISIKLGAENLKKLVKEIETQLLTFRHKAHIKFTNNVSICIGQYNSILEAKGQRYPIIFIDKDLYEIESKELENAGKIDEIHSYEYSPEGLKETLIDCERYTHFVPEQEVGKDIPLDWLIEL